MPLHFGCIVCRIFLCGKCICHSHSGEQSNCKVFEINEALIRLRKIIIEELVEKEKVIRNDAETSEELTLSSNFLNKEVHNSVGPVQQIIELLQQKKEVYERQTKGISQKLESVSKLKNKLSCEHEFGQTCKLLASFKKQTSTQKRISNNAFFRVKRYQIVSCHLFNLLLL